MSHRLLRELSDRTVFLMHFHDFGVFGSCASDML